MIHVGVNLDINPELVVRLSAGQKLWSAVHDDGSKNRINGDVILEAGSYGTSFGILAALFMWIKKKYRNKGKTKEDLAAEKEAAAINRTCGALEVMLQEYLQSAQNGTIDEKGLDELIGTLEEIQEYNQTGKLIIPGTNELAEIRKSIERYTTAIAENKNSRLAHESKATGASEFLMIREQLVQQRELIRNT